LVDTEAVPAESLDCGSGGSIDFLQVGVSLLPLGGDGVVCGEVEALIELVRI